MNIFETILSWYRPKDQILLQEVAQKAGYVFGKKHPELIAPAKIVAMGITSDQGKDAKVNLEIAAYQLANYCPEIEKQIKFLLMSIDVLGTEITPIILSFIEGMEAAE